MASESNFANHSNWSFPKASELKSIWDGGIVQQSGPVDDNASEAGIAKDPEPRRKPLNRQSPRRLLQRYCQAPSHVGQFKLPPT